MRSNLIAAEGSIDFLSLDLTNQCNLQCTHCYADAGPYNRINDLLERANYADLIRDGFELGSKSIQFIGGEPILNKNLPHFISYAHNTGYEFIEVFSNLTQLTPALIDCFVEYGVNVATSVYAPSDAVHDRITKTKGSFTKTIKGITALIERGVEVRVGVTEMEENYNLVDETRSMLEGLGVQSIGGEKMRHVGRGDCSQFDELTELCGGCNGKTLSVGSDGVVSPCIMSKKMAIGSVRDNTLSQLSESDELAKLRSELSRKHGKYAMCDPKSCTPYQRCGPTDNGCTPCYPKG